MPSRTGAAEGSTCGGRSGGVALALAEGRGIPGHGSGAERLSGADQAERLLGVGSVVAEGRSECRAIRSPGCSSSG